MPFNGAGTFNRIYSWVQDAANGIFVSSTRTDTDTNDIAAGLTNCVTRDGQSPATANLPMGGYKLTNLALGTAASDSVRYSQLVDASPLSVCDFRLTLTSGVPVTTTDVLAAETLYWTPYRGNRIALYDGSAWSVLTSAQISIDVPDATNCYDVFVYNNAGTPTLELAAWTDVNNRATALTTQDGVLVKTGATNRRYLGTFYSTTAGNGQIEDSIANRYLWNYYNRVQRKMQAVDNTASWNYTTATIRQANGSTANQLNFVIGVLEDSVTARVRCQLSNTSANVEAWVGIGDNVTNATTGPLQRWSTVQTTQVASRAQLSAADYDGYPFFLGKNFLAWVEFSAATGTTTFYSGGASGIQGELQG